jgi:hypothetical protein
MLAIILFACNSGELTAFPSNISWGDIDFRNNPPEEGFDAQNIALTNTGTQNIDIELGLFDNIHLCLTGLDGTPQSLGTLEPDQTYNLLVGVCDYIEEEGERDTEISGTIEIVHTGVESPEVITWSFTPVFIIE